MKKVLLPLIAVCCLSPVVAFAGHPLLTDAAETVAPKSFEAETAVEFYMDKQDGVKWNSFVAQETITGGIIPKVDAFVSVPFSTYKADFAGAERESGINDITVGVKYNFINIDKAAFAVKPFVVIPTGDDKKGLGAGAVGFGGVAVASLEVDKHISVDVNASYKYQDQSTILGDSYNEFGASLAGKFEATNELKVVGEVNFSKADKKDFEGKTEKAKSVLGVGAIYAVQKNIDVDLGARVGLTKDTTADFGALAGVTLKF